MKGIVKQPLVHFLLIGLVLAVFHSQLSKGQPDVDANHLRVERQGLLDYMQYRVKNFDPNRIERELDSMAGEQKAQLIGDYIREEVLYREAQKMGLSENDFVIRQRLIQKMLFLTQGLIETNTELTDAQVTRFYLQHQQDYVRPETLTFTHVFFAPDTVSADELKRLQQQMNASRISAAQAMSLGQAFLYHRHYTARSAELIASHFGKNFTQQLMTMPVRGDYWQAPVRSEQGWHLVLLQARQTKQYPELDTIRSKVTEDALQYYAAERADELINQVIARYTVDNRLTEAGSVGGQP